LTEAASDDEFERALEAAVLAHAPPGAVIVGVSVSPDRRHGASLTLLPSATDYPMDDLFERLGDRWVDAGGGSGTGISWSSISDDGSRGVLRYGGEAPPDATIARIAYEGREHEVPVRHGHFLFVAWDTDFHEDPKVIAFECSISQ
jgi:hypothetical protein